MLRKTILGLAGAAAIATTFGFAQPAEAGRISVLNNAGVVARVKWKVASSESGWTNLALGEQTYRDYPENYPNIEVKIEYLDVFVWKGACTKHLTPARNWNLTLKGTAFNLGCSAD